MADEWKTGIKHVVLLMLENRSFEHMLGDIQKVPAKDRFDAAKPKVNTWNGHDYPQQLGAARQLPADPHHEYADVLLQLAGGNSGFVAQYGRTYPNLTPAQLAEVMKVHGHGSLPVLHPLADTFAVFSHWHACLPGPTWPNRLFALSGTSLGRAKMPTGILNLNLHLYTQDTLFDRLNEKKISWRVYHDDFPLSMLFVHQLEPSNASRYDSIHQLYIDATKPPDQFPTFVLVEPAYMGSYPTDDHPCHDVMGGEQTLLFVVFDEHGGFYDSVVPPATIPPDEHHEEFDFKQLGLRVPAVLVSPWAANTVIDTPLDHTAFLKFLTDWWGLGPLLARTANWGQTLQPAFLPKPTNLGPQQLIGLPKLQPTAAEQLNDHQAAMVALSQAIEAQGEDSAVVVAQRATRALAGAEDQTQVALERIHSFIAHQKSKTP
jgi:phospholipase C